MAWTHYTGDLARGAQITSAMRNELYDAIEERFLLVSPGAGYSLGASLADLRASALLTDVIDYTWNGSGFQTTLPILLETLATRYATAYEGITHFTSDTFRAAVGAAYGLDATQVAALWYPTGFGGSLRGKQISADWWNLVREGIRQLKYGKLTAQAATTWQRSGFDTDWGDLIAAVTSASEASPGSPLGAFAASARAWNTDGEYSVQLRRSVSSLYLPEIAALENGYDMWTWSFSSANGADGYGSDTLHIAIGSATASWAVSGADGGTMRSIGTGFTETGTVIVEGTLASYGDSSALNTYLPPTNESRGMLASGDAPWIAPNFTHP
jgi:hypothetical protein